MPTNLLRISVIFRYEVKVRGAIFWTVDNKKAWGHRKPSITWGNQKGNGALPIFKSSENKMSDNLIIVIEINKNPEEINKADPIGWIKKYLRAASEK